MIFCPVCFFNLCDIPNSWYRGISFVQYPITHQVAQQYTTSTFARRVFQWSSFPLFLVLLVIVSSAVMSNLLWLFAPRMLCAKKSGKYETETTCIPEYIEGAKSIIFLLFTARGVLCAQNFETVNGCFTVLEVSRSENLCAQKKGYYRLF